MSVNDETPPGWYRDTAAVNIQRYWDGEKWTEQVQPMSADTASGVTRGVLTAALVVVGVLLVCWVVYSLAHANDDLDCATENAERSATGQPPLDCG